MIVEYVGISNYSSIINFICSIRNTDCPSFISRKEMFKRFTKTKLLKQMHINDAYINLYLNNVFCCDFSFSISFALMPNGKIDFCTINFDDTKAKNTCDYFSEYDKVYRNKLLNRCREKDCVLYPNALVLNAIKLIRKYIVRI